VWPCIVVQIPERRRIIRQHGGQYVERREERHHRRWPRHQQPAKAAPKPPGGWGCRPKRTPLWLPACLSMNLTSPSINLTYLSMNLLCPYLASVHKPHLSVHESSHLPVSLICPSVHWLGRPPVCLDRHFPSETAAPAQSPCVRARARVCVCDACASASQAAHLNRATAPRLAPRMTRVSSSPKGRHSGGTC
jgi:hypothetical protein